MTTTATIPAQLSLPEPYAAISQHISYLFRAGYQLSAIVDLLNARYPATFYWGGTVLDGSLHVQIEETLEDCAPVVIWKAVPKVPVTVTPNAIRAEDL